MNAKFIEDSKLRLYDSFHNSRDMIDLLHTAATLFENPIILTSSSYRVIHMSNPTGQPFDDLVWNDAEKYGYCSAESIRLFRRDGVTSSVHENDQPVFIDYSVGKEVPRIIQKLKGDNKIIAYFGLFQANKQISEEDIILVEILCKILEVAFAASRYEDLSLSNHIHESIMLQLLESRIPRNEVFQERLTAANWHTKKLFHLIFVPLKKDDSSVYYDQYLQRKIDETVSISKSVIYNENVILVINSDNERELDRAKKKISTLLKKNNLAAICSPLFTDLYDLPIYYHQAVDTFHVLNILKKNKFGLIDVNDFLVSTLLYKLPKDINYDLYLCQEFKIIREYDTIHQTNFEEVLVAYLENSCNIRKSAECLYIHRNTMQQKLKHIGELIGDVNEGELLLKFYHSSKLFRWAEKLEEH
ncbi:PucR family transcriptional regulator [Enterococcus sp. AZ109]|uniref:PucR family transcriptional regulator n=1 Tax=Enterococcus sp. AZ109 TaxID=2774634 RepID=UPI003F1F5D53